MGYKAIGEYGVIGDRRTAALVGRDGSVDWLCLPDFDGPSVFGALLDDAKGGRFRLGTASGAMGEQQYVKDTNVLRTRFDALEVMDCLTRPGSRSDQEQSRRVLLRRLEAKGGAAECELVCVPRYDYGREPASVEHIDAGVIFHGPGPVLSLTVPGAEEDLEIGEQGVHARLRLGPGQVRWVVLTTMESAGELHEWTAGRAEAEFEETLRYWREWSKVLGYPGPYRDEMVRCALVVHLLTYAPKGSVVAAPTTSLPEHVGGPKNYDYRFAWVRDASLSVAVLSILGHLDDAQAYMDWLVSLPRDERNNAPLQVLYGIRGEAELSERTLDHLEGYRGSQPVRVGNHAYKQFQMDSFGILQDCVERYLSHGGEWREEYWELVSRVAEFVADNWHREGHDIWELGAGGQWTNARMLAWVGLERAVRIARRLGKTEPVERWQRTMGEIHEEVMRQGWNHRQRSFVQRYGTENLDAAVLLGPVLGFLPGRHPRVLDTLERLQERLGDQGMLRRFDPKETPGVAPVQEGAFNPCTLWRVSSLARAGRAEEAERVLRRFLQNIEPLGLAPEEMDPETGEMLGNYPLLFSQVELVRAGLLLSRSDLQHRARAMAVKGVQTGADLVRRGGSRVVDILR